MIDKKTTLYDLHVQSGAKMIPFAGFLMPVRYTSDKDEHLRVRQKAGIFDVSHMGEFFISGKGALELIQYVTSNDASKLEDGKAQYSY
ncbi:MAG: glycine cleavage system aminomethyltransferase GcvT, partial [Cyclobacteriaceae bacterium]|nr:glycine cleavage system aminomethyltransferase GcvT [Cyclobacteriaceae bacterium]